MELMASLPIDDEHAALYTVGQVAAMLGVQPALLRRLEAFDVINPSRSDGGQRRYSRAHIRRAHAAIELLAEDGMTIAGVRRVLNLQAEVDRLNEKLANRRTTPGTGASPARPVARQRRSRAKSTKTRSAR
jgi:MerR family transcriptional regulator/heat shock protein HspR